MNNLEWLYEHERDKLVKLIVGEYDMCDICFYDPNFPDCGGDCERNVREWLDDVHSEQIQDKDEHVDDESCRQDADQREHAETPTASKWQSNDAQDNREKLEADCTAAWKSVERVVRSGGTPKERWTNSEFFNLLDRQAAITERHWMEIVGASANANVELKRQIDERQARVDELTEQLESAHAKNRALKAHIAKMQEGRHGWHIKGKELQQQVDSLKRKLEAATDANTDYRDEWHRVCAERANLARDLGNAMAERDRYRELCGKLLDAADDMRRVRDQFDAFTEVD